MIQTNPSYVHGDDFTIGEYFKGMIRNKRFLYTSMWNWWKKTTLYISAPLGIASVLIFAALLYQELGLREEADWALVVSCSLLPFICFLPIIWIITYYQSVVSPKQTTRKIEDFISRYIPDADNVNRHSITNYTLTRGGIKFEVGYTILPEIDSKERIKGHYEYFFIVLYYKPQPDYEFQWMDEDGCMKDEFREEWDAYCRDKESCKHLFLANDKMYAMFKRKELSAPHEVTDSLNQLQYLLRKLHCFSLYANPTWEEKIINWLRSIDLPTPTDITAIYIGLFESESSSYMLYLIGARHYDENDDDWACVEDFVPKQKYADIYEESIEKAEWEEIQHAVIKVISQYAEKRAEDASSLFYHKIVTVGFDGGDLTRVR
ncbi:MAG: hypothetical protein Q4D36_06740 [Bacteroidales bacterium]|nr:hypothetical protein [Bacteroidales bacterium]